MYPEIPMIFCSRKNMGVSSIGDFLLVAQFSEPSGSYLLRSLIVEFPKKVTVTSTCPPKNSRDIDLRELAIGFNKNWMFQWMIF